MTYAPQPVLMIGELNRMLSVNEMKIFAKPVPKDQYLKVQPECELTCNKRYSCLQIQLPPVTADEVSADQSGSLEA